MSARMFAVGKWEAGEERPVIRTGHNNVVLALDGSKLTPEQVIGILDFLEYARWEPDVSRLTPEQIEAMLADLEAEYHDRHSPDGWGDDQDTPRQEDLK